MCREIQVGVRACSERNEGGLKMVEDSYFGLLIGGGVQSKCPRRLHPGSPVDINLNSG